MRWKVVLSLLLILVLAGILLATDFGKNYADFLRTGLGNLVGSFSFLPPPAGSFEILLEGNTRPFYGQVFTAANSTLTAEAVCATNIRINELTLDKADRKCEISAAEAKGKFEITTGGSIILSFDTNSLSLDQSLYSGKMHVDAELVPLNFLVTGITNDKISLQGVDGELKKFSPDGSIGQTNTLKNETVTISHFAGLIQWKDSKIILQGIVSSVEGSTFKITK